LVSNKKANSKQYVLYTDSDVGFSEENPITSNKKQKPAPSSNTFENEERVGLVLPYHQPNTSINQVATGERRKRKLKIEKLGCALCTSISCRIIQEEIATLQDQLAYEKAYSRDIGHLNLQNASLKKENRSLAHENSTILAEVVEEKQQIQKEVLAALAYDQAHSSSRTFVSRLEDRTKQAMT
jgi:hypothetical protein